jgi:microcin C transport system substrate-binding protein
VLGQQVESVEKLDDHRVRFTFKEGWPTRDLPGLVGGLPIFSQAHYVANDRDFEASRWSRCSVPGPMCWSVCRRARPSSIRRNPDYWGWDLPIMQGRSNFDRIRIEYYADYDAAFEGFKAGSYTFRTEARAALWAQGYDFPALERGHVVRKELPDGNLATGQSFIFNLRRDSSRTPRARGDRADVQLRMVERDAVQRPVCAHPFVLGKQRTGRRGACPATESWRSWSRWPTSAAARGADRRGGDGARVRRCAQLDRGNLRRASALLDEAGWEVGDDGLRRNADGQAAGGVPERQPELRPDHQPLCREPARAGRRRAAHAGRQRADDQPRTQLRLRHDHRPAADVADPGVGSEAVFRLGNRRCVGVQQDGAEIASGGPADRRGAGAETREEMEVTPPARWTACCGPRSFWVPQWYKATHWVAYYDMYEHPEELPPYALGNSISGGSTPTRPRRLRAAGAIR